MRRRTVLAAMASVPVLAGLAAQPAEAALSPVGPTRAGTLVVLGWKQAKYALPTDLQGGTFTGVSTNAGELFYMYRYDRSVVAWSSLNGVMVLPWNTLLSVDSDRYGGLTTAVSSQGTLLSDGLQAVCPLPAGTGMKSVAVARTTAVVLKSDGTVVAAGAMFDGSAARVPQGLSHLVQVVNNDAKFLAVRDDGVVFNWTETGQLLAVPSNVSQAVAVAADRHTNTVSALQMSGTVMVWTQGSNAPAVPVVADAIRIAMCWTDITIGSTLTSTHLFVQHKDGRVDDCNLTTRTVTAVPAFSNAFSLAGNVTGVAAVVPKIYS